MINNSTKKIYECLKTNTDALEKKIGANVCYGTVIEKDPFVIFVSERGNLPQNFFEFSPFCYDFYAEGLEFMPEKEFVSTEEAGDPEHIHKIELPEKFEFKYPQIKIKLWRGLEIGDKVSLIACSNRQKFYVIGRQGMEVIENDTSA